MQVLQREKAPPAAKPKGYRGQECQACDLDFEKRYGVLGKGFIETHHLRPIAPLDEGVAISYEVVTDFAGRCSNCYPMIHRTADPSDLKGFRGLATKV